MGGVNLPKLVECIGSDGKSYKQLVKGKDDLRQDAVMQQLFSFVNTLLEEKVSTRKRKLKIRGYKIIPLSPVSGLLEWVENTMPLGEYLIGNPRNSQHSAHSRYYPKAPTSLACRKLITQASDKEKVHTFEEICKQFLPVFHHFFLEKFPSPPQWFERRLTYTRSVAASSIVGYIVGLGDRHSQNILIDKTTAEIVHIDLGVAFDQGKTLRTPETVPFRLTRDMVDGMGLPGVEGIFRRCCEETLKVLRANTSSLLTIVEVFLHDPLYRWALSPLQALSLQRDDVPILNLLKQEFPELLPSQDSNQKGNFNSDAERTLLRIKQKLQGFEYGEVLSVEGQVSQLIQEAQDKERLAKLFPGWASWV